MRRETRFGWELFTHEDDGLILKYDGELLFQTKSSEALVAFLFRILEKYDGVPLNLKEIK